MPKHFKQAVLAGFIFDAVYDSRTLSLLLCTLGIIAWISAFTLILEEFFKSGMLVTEIVF